MGEHDPFRNEVLEKVREVVEETLDYFIERLHEELAEVDAEANTNPGLIELAAAAGTDVFMSEPACQVVGTEVGEMILGRMSGMLMDIVERDDEKRRSHLTVVHSS